MESVARIALIMTFRNEAATLPALLASLDAQTFDPARRRLIAVDNGSTDASGGIVAAWLAAQRVPGELLRFDEPSIPRALNLALERVRRSEYVVRIDAHTVCGPGYLTQIASAFERLPGDVWCVGGFAAPIEPKEFGKALHGALFENPMGLGSGRRDGKDSEVSSVYLGAWRPGVLERVGGYDPRWHANEDAELAARVRESGGRIVAVAADVHNTITRGAWAAVAQRARYGYWRAKTARRHPTTLKLRHVLPPLALPIVAGLALSNRIALLALLECYAAAVWTMRPREQRLDVAVASLVYFPLVQCAFALGLIAGFFSETERMRSPAAGDPALVLR